MRTGGGGGGCCGGVGRGCNAGSCVTQDVDIAIDEGEATHPDCRCRRIQRTQALFKIFVKKWINKQQ